MQKTTDFRPTSKRTRLLSAGDRTAQLQSAEALLAMLRTRLDGPVPPELKRRIVEVLVETVEANTVERWGVQQSEVVITYRFSQPDEPAALVLPRSHKIHSRNSPPEELNTIGDHLLRRRLALKLLQRQVAEQIGVDKTSITNWESNRTKPGLVYMPAIIRFLGYNPLPPATSGRNGWSSAGPRWESRRKKRPRGSALTRARWLDGSAGAGASRYSRDPPCGFL